MTEKPKCNEIMQNDADDVPETLNKQEVLPNGVYLFDCSEEDSVKLFANGARVNEARANNLVSSTQSTDSSDSTELHTNNSYRDSNNPIIFIPEKVLTNSSTSTLSNGNVPKKEYAYVSIVRGEDTGARPTGDVPKDIHVRQGPPTDPEENKTTDPNFQRESPTDEISTEPRKQIHDVTISHELISSTKTQVVNTRTSS